MAAKDKLPSDKFEPTEADEKKPQEATAAPEALIAAVDAIVKFLLVDPTNWKIQVPQPLDRWQPLYHGVLDGGTNDELQKARNLIKEHGTLMRVYAGVTEKERLLVVRQMGTTYAKMEVIPWTMGK